MKCRPKKSSKAIAQAEVPVVQNLAVKIYIINARFSRGPKCKPLIEQMRHDEVEQRYSKWWSADRRRSAELWSQIHGGLKAGIEQF